eukprot:15484338-Alexandrium_andersonii.AAC.1
MDCPSNNFCATCRWSSYWSRNRSSSMPKNRAGFEICAETCTSSIGERLEISPVFRNSKKPNA